MANEMKEKFEEKLVELVGDKNSNNVYRVYLTHARYTTLVS